MSGGTRGYCAIKGNRNTGQGDVVSQDRIKVKRPKSFKIFLMLLR